MPRQTDRPADHDSLAPPQGPFRDTELDVLWKPNGDSTVNLVRDAETRIMAAVQQAAPVVNVTVPVPAVTVAAPVVNCTHGCVGHCVHDSDGGTVLAFILALLGFVLTWVGMLLWTDEAGWRCALTGVIVGGGIGAAYFAVTDGLNRRWR